MASASMSAHVEGVPELVRDLRAIGLVVEDPKDALKETASEGARIVSGLMPHDSGFMAANVFGRTEKAAAYVEATAPYAGVQNYGWPEHNITGSGFMQRADQPWEPYALRAVERDIDTAIARQGLR